MAKQINDMTITELRSELRKTQRQRADLKERLDAKQALLDTIDKKSEDRLVKRIVDAIQEIIPYGAMRRL